MINLAKRREFRLQAGNRFTCRLFASVAVGITAGVFPSTFISLAQPLQPRFEVASIKPADPAEPVFGMRIQPGRFSVSNATLEMLIGFAYALPNSQVAGGPNWARSESFTIEAGVDAATPIPAGNAGVSQIMLMVKSLLAERFQLSSHQETRQLPVYELVVANGGPKLKQSEGGRPPSRRIGRGQLTGSMPIPLLATSVSQWVDRPVIDKTGLRGNYDVELTYSPDVGQGTRFGAAEADAPSANGNAPSLFSALREELGLQLKASRGPVQILVIDRVERPDTN